MTTHQARIFVHRLLNREVTEAELADLSAKELTDINIYLLEYRSVLELERWDAPGLEYFAVGSMIINRAPQGSYSEQEILTELGITA